MNKLTLILILFTGCQGVQTGAKESIALEGRTFSMAAADMDKTDQIELSFRTGGEGISRVYEGANIKKRQPFTWSLTGDSLTIRSVVGSAAEASKMDTVVVTSHIMPEAGGYVMSFNGQEMVLTEKK